MRKFNFHLVIYRYEVLLGAIILLLTGSISVSSRDAGKLIAPERIYPYKIALTFDDGPYPEYTGRLVKLLEENGVKATFFLVGSRAMQHPELVRLLVSNGHEIESHTLTHRNMAHLSASEIKNELSKSVDLLNKISGCKISYFRPPGGQYNLKVVKSAELLGLNMALWTVFPKDHEEPDPAVITSKILQQAADGGVVLLHSGREPTITALPVAIKLLRDRGYRFVTLSELMEDTPKDKLVWLK